MPAGWGLRQESLHQEMLAKMLLSGGALLSSALCSSVRLYCFCTQETAVAENGPAQQSC